MRALGDWPRTLAQPLILTFSPQAAAGGEKGRLGASAVADSPENLPQVLEKVESAPGKLGSPGRRRGPDELLPCRTAIPAPPAMETRPHDSPTAQSPADRPGRRSGHFGNGTGESDSDWR